MAKVVRWFDSVGAGLADGTSHANRAQFVNAGTYSAVITGFNFSGSDSLECLLEPGTYTVTAAIASGLFANPPTVANPLFIHGADASGNKLDPSNPNWTSAEVVDWDSGLPVLAATTNMAHLSLATCYFRLIKLTSSGRTGGSVVTAGRLDWIVIENSTSNTGTAGCSGLTRGDNIAVVMSGTAYDFGFSAAGDHRLHNIRAEGNLSASSGNRRGATRTGASVATWFSDICIFNHVGDGFIDLSTGTGATMAIDNIVVANCTGNGIKLNATASQTNITSIHNAIVTGCGAWGLDGQNANTWLCNARFRDNTSGNITGVTNYPTDNYVYTTDSDDASEYVDATNKNFLIKNTATIWGRGLGVGDQAASSGGVTARVGIHGLLGVQVG